MDLKGISFILGECPSLTLVPLMKQPSCWIYNGLMPSSKSMSFFKCWTFLLRPLWADWRDAFFLERLILFHKEEQEQEARSPEFQSTLFTSSLKCQNICFYTVQLAGLQGIAHCSLMVCKSFPQTGVNSIQDPLPPSSLCCVLFLIAITIWLRENPPGRWSLSFDEIWLWGFDDQTTFNTPKGKWKILPLIITIIVTVIFHMWTWYNCFILPNNFQQYYFINLHRKPMKWVRLMSGNFLHFYRWEK